MIIPEISYEIARKIMDSKNLWPTEEYSLVQPGLVRALREKGWNEEKLNIVIFGAMLLTEMLEDVGENVRLQ